MPTPVVFLAFANDVTQHLPMLEEESRNIDLMLRDWHNRELIELRVIRNANLKDIYDAINQYKDRMAIFHYSGHATSTKLLLDDEAANAFGIARMLAAQAQQSLQLVFLNGCSTQEQVTKLHEYGVPAVIATSVPIADNKAQLFAQWFYQSLCNLYSIEEAFNGAAAFLDSNPLLHDSLGYSLEVQRGAGQRQKAEQTRPWGLYLRPNLPADWAWKFPQFQSGASPTGPIVYTGNYHPNALIPDILETMLIYKPAIKREMYTDDDERIDRSDYADLIIRHFPLPIAVQIQKLVSNESGDQMNEASQIRLRQIASTYTVTTQTIAFILISELWDNKRKQSFRFQTPMSLRLLLEKPKELASVYNYLDIISALCREYQNLDLKTYVTEFYKDDHQTPAFLRLTNEADELFEACKALETLKSNIARNQIPDSELEEACKQGEEKLVQALRGFAFLAKYKMLTVRDIEYYRPRFQDQQFQHRYANLNLSVDNKIAIKEKRIISTQSADSGSVVLVKKASDLSDFLSLSPFIIDRYAFEERSDSHIYLYAYQMGGEFVFFRSTSDVYRATEETDDQLSTRPGEMDDNTLYLDLIKTQFKMLRDDLIRGG